MSQIAEILKSLTDRGKRLLFVHWLGYISDFDSWISAEDVHNGQ